MAQVIVARAVLQDEKSGTVELYNEEGNLLAVITDEIGCELETIRIGVATMVAMQDSRSWG